MLRTILASLWLAGAFLALDNWAFAQSDSPLTITQSGYYLTTIGADGSPSYVQIKTVVDLTGRHEPGPKDPEPPALDIELVAKVKAWAADIADPQSAQAIAAVYAHIRGALADSTLTSESVWTPLKQATDSALGVIQASADWSPFRSKLTEAFTDAKQRGRLSSVADIERVLLSVQHGVELSADGATAITMDQMVEIARRTNLAIDGARK